MSGLYTGVRLGGLWVAQEVAYGSREDCGIFFSAAFRNGWVAALMRLCAGYGSWVSSMPLFLLFCFSLGGVGFESIEGV